MSASVLTTKEPQLQKCLQGDACCLTLQAGHVHVSAFMRLSLSLLLQYSDRLDGSVENKPGLSFSWNDWQHE